MINIGLIIIIASWLIQFLYTSPKNKKINPLFIGFYCLGVVILVLDGFQTGFTTATFLNFVSLLAAFAVFIKIAK